MKKQTIVLAVVGILLCVAQVHAGPEPFPGYDKFYHELRSDGVWINVNPYGWVWRPYVAVNNETWRPYVDNGHWVETDNGQYWKSDYSWGHIPFHYGRWAQVKAYGWIWVPDEEWAPAWVTWRQTDEHYGWAPLPPGVRYDPYNPGSGTQVSVGVDFGLGRNDYTFVPHSRMFSVQVSRYALPYERVVYVYPRSSVYHRRSYGVSSRRYRDPHHGTYYYDHPRRETYYPSSHYGYTPYYRPGQTTVRYKGSLSDSVNRSPSTTSRGRYDAPPESSSRKNKAPSKAASRKKRRVREEEEPPPAPVHVKVKGSLKDALR